MVVKQMKPEFHREFGYLNLTVIHKTAMAVEMEPTLEAEIKKAQLEGGKLKEIRQLITDNKTSDFTEDDHGTMWLGKHICVPNPRSIQELILWEAHDSAYSIHLGSSKTRYWWYDKKRDIVEYVSLCDTCQRVKAEHQRPAGLLQPLKIPEWKWEEIRMDFIVGLPRTQAGYDSILLIVDRLTKVALSRRCTLELCLPSYTSNGLYVCMEYLRRLCPTEDPILHLNFGRSFMNLWTPSSTLA
jgi:hypothetical protein